MTLSASKTKKSDSQEFNSSADLPNKPMWVLAVQEQPPTGIDVIVMDMILGAAKFSVKKAPLGNTEAWLMNPLKIPFFHDCESCGNSG